MRLGVFSEKKTVGKCRCLPEQGLQKKGQLSWLSGSHAYDLMGHLPIFQMTKVADCPWVIPNSSVSHQIDNHCYWGMLSPQA